MKVKHLEKENETEHEVRFREEMMNYEWMVCFQNKKKITQFVSRISHDDDWH